MIKNEFLALLKQSITDNWFEPAFSNYNKKSYSYRDVATKIILLHSYFKSLHLEPGDKIALLGKNSVNWAITYLSVISYGAVIVPILPDFKAGDAHHIINHSDSKLLFVESAIFENLDIDQMRNIEMVFSLQDFRMHFSRKSNYKQKIEKANSNYLEPFGNRLLPSNFDFQDSDLDDLAAIVYTSGTTGFSKGVMLPFRSLNANIIYARNNMPLQPGDKIVSFLPIAHVFGCAFEFLFPFSSGCHITFLGKTPSPKIIIKAFSEIQPRLILSVPLVIEKIYNKQIKPVLQKPAMNLLLKFPLTKKIIHKKINAKLTAVFGNNFREIVIGGAPLNNEVEEFLRTINFRFTVGYGMTECGPLISYVNWKNYKLGSTGKIIDFLDVKIDSADQKNEVGEILVKGENVMQGYYKNEEATESSLQNGWLRTGDLGVIDEEKFIFIRGRSKSMILGASGKNIYPEELESRLNNLPYVSESLVVQRKGKLIALVYPDMELVDLNKISETELEDIMRSNRKKMNELFPDYINISKIEIYPEEFEKTPKKSIKRFLYNQ